MLELCVPRGTAFHAEGHHPIPAGINTSGEKTYLARLGYQSGPDKIVPITEGTTPEDVRERNEGTGRKGKKHPLYMAIYALRHAPDRDIRNESGGNEQDYASIDSLFWKPLLVENAVNE